MLHENKDPVVVDNKTINTIVGSLKPSSKMAGMDERQAFAKLEALKDIRNKTINLEKTRVSLLCDVGQMEDEDRCLQEYRRELELLQQEKMAHVEELRQIHADINAMETIIKQAEESRRSAQVTEFSNHHLEIFISSRAV